MKNYSEELEKMRQWFADQRFADILRLHTPAQVVEQRGTIDTEYSVARDAAAAFYARLRELFAAGKSITTRFILWNRSSRNLPAWISS